MQCEKKIFLLFKNTDQATFLQCFKRAFVFTYITHYTKSASLFVFFFFLQREHSCNLEILLDDLAGHQDDSITLYLITIPLLAL